MLRTSAKMPRVRIVASRLGRKGCQCAPDEAINSTSMCVEIRESGEGVLERKWVVGFKVPLLNNRKVKVSGKIPRLSSLKLKPAGAVSEQAEVPAVAAKPAPEPVRAVEAPPDVAAKVAAPRTEKGSRPKRAKAVLSELAAPRPLKVIRRRKEEAPKVFETPPKIVPKAMLEGIDLEQDTDAEN